MTGVDLLILALTGVAAGIVSTVASLASVVSYPVLLALGLPPLSANVTNTFSLMFTGIGAAAGSRPELAGQGRLIRRLGPVAAAGGAAGAALLLALPARTFEYVAPMLIGGGSLVLLLRPEQDISRPQAHRDTSPFLIAVTFCVSAYVGYFGAAGGILLLAVLTSMLSQSLARTNAVKNVLSGAANGVAAVAFAIFGPVRWAAVAPLAAGFLLGGWIGPKLVRRLPARLLRIAISLAGIGLAIRLGLSAYG
ncbi:MAG TPA: sulfite exporter TauE/SafE family protein [Streptosporangiaceae bacterium]|nr:sulfite exporter TauE/SafE family protein [Streptosporangiaceae bacterium]